MLKTLTITGSLILVASAGFAQQTLQAKQVPSRLQKAGVYHVGTGTWTRGVKQTLTPANKRFYANSANSGFFGVMGIGQDLIWTDEGCIPGSGHIATAKDGPFEIQTIDFGYCSNVIGTAQTGGFDFYDSYASCTNPASLTPIASLGFAVPGAGSSGGNCWLVTFDLTASSAQFNMSSDGDGTFDGSSALDNFGWTLILNDQGAGGFNGPLLRGDPNSFPYGDGTYYQNSGASYATGLDTKDQFWLTDPSASYVNGCYWFGGYTGGNPFASFWLDLDGKNVTGGGTKYCVANPNSTGSPADIEMKQEGTANGPVYYILSASPVPNQPGIFFKANNQNDIPFGCGHLCATGGLVRGGVTFGSGNRMQWTYDWHLGPQHDLRSRIGLTQDFQAWFRDPMGCSSAYNTSNGLEFQVH